MERHRPRLKRRLGRVLWGLPLLFLALFFAWPVLSLVWRGLGDDPGRVGEVLTGSRFQQTIWFTVWQAAVSTVVAGLVALPMSWLVANRRFPGRKLLLASLTVPFVLPTVVVAGAFLATLDRFGLDRGAWSLRRSVWLIVAAHVFFNIAVVVRSVGGFWSQLDRSGEEVARSLGATPWQAFREVTFPRLTAPLLASLSIVYLFSFTSFALVLILGEGRRATIETEIFRYAFSQTDFATAAVLAIVQMAIVAVLLLVNARLERRSPTSERLVVERGIPFAGWPDRMIGAAIICGTGVLLTVPLISMIARSLQSGGAWSLTHYRSLGSSVRLLPVSPLQSLVNSLGFAVLAAAIAVMVGGLAAVVIAHGPRSISRLTDLGMLLPLGTSAVVVGLGFLLAFGSFPPGTGFDLRSSWMIIPLAQALIAMPFVTRSVVPVLRAIRPEIRDAAATLGASAAVVRREVDFPVGRRALLAGAGFAFAISLGEFGATSFVGRQPRYQTLPLAIERLLGQPGDQLQGQAMALAVVLMLVTASVILLVDRLNPSGRVL